MSCANCLHSLQRSSHPAGFWSLTRRTLLKSLFGLGLGLPFFDNIANATRKKNPRRSRLTPGDRLVFAFDDRKGQPITPEDILLGERPAFAYPMDPITEVVRSRFRLNQVLLIRLKPEELSERTREHALGGLVCYSAVCTHTGCDVSEWIGPTQNLVCPCHASFFNPKDRGRVVGGPAPKPLATLPLEVVDGVLTVKAPFIGRVGFKKKKK